MIETFIPEWSSNRQVKDRHQQIEKDPLTVAGAEGRSRQATIPALAAWTVRNADALPLESPALPGRVSPQWQLQGSASGNGDPPLTVAGAEGRSRLATIPALAAWAVRVRSIAAHNVPSRPSEANGYCASQSARYNLL